MKTTSGIYINVENIAFNYQQIKKAAAGLPVIAVVKADAYGHGMQAVVRRLEQEADKPLLYAVAKLSEALELRQSFPDVAILLFEPVSKENVETIAAANITGTITQTNLDEIRTILDKVNTTLNVHLKINTGMNRLGVSIDEVVGVYQDCGKVSAINLTGLYTHLADSDNTDYSYTERQHSRFVKVLNELREAGIQPGLIHACNSGGIWFHKNMHFNAVRPGISLYGYYPSSYKGEYELKPGMDFISSLESIRLVEAEESVSYALGYISKSPMRIGTLPFGYADGIPRIMSNRMQVLINGRYFPQVGRITMDRILIDLTNAPEVKVGDSVILLGHSGEAKIDAWDWSKWAETIPYEITCSLNCKRMPKFYKN